MPTRRAQLAASILALLTAVSIWLSAGTVFVTGGDTSRIAALPSFWILGVLAAATLAAALLIRLRLEHAWPLAISLLLWLPFLPGDLPPSFLLWEGPIEGAVWAVVVAGLIAARPPAAPKALRRPSSAPWIAAVLLVASGSIAFSQVRGVIPGGDEPHYLAATQSLLHDGDLRVANNYAKGEYLDFFPGHLEPHYLKRARSGEIYSIHAPGISAIVLPGFAAAGYVGAVATMLLIAALTAMLTWRLAFRVSGSSGAAWAGTLAVFATTPYFFHAFTIYPEIIGSFCVMCGVWLLIELADGRTVSPRLLIAIGSALALLPWLHSRFAVIAAILGVLVATRLAHRSSAASNIVRFLAVPIVAGAAWFAFFYEIWGSPSPTAPYGADTSTSAAYVLRGLIGLLVDQQFGVLTTAPVYLCAIAGGVVLYTRPRLSIELGLIVIPYAIAVASYAMWWAGAAAPARFLVSILPLAALPIAAMWSRSRVLVVLLLLASIALIVPRVFVDEGRFIYNNHTGIDATLQWLTSSVNLPLALPSVHRSGGSIAMRDAAIWIAGLGVAAVLAAMTARRWATGAQFAATGILMAIAAIASSGAVWAFAATDGFDADRSKLSAIGRLRPWHTAIIDLTSRRSISRAEAMSAMSIDLRPGQRVNRLAAGEYVITANSAIGGPVTLSVGRSDPPIESRPAGDTATFRLRLPVRLQSLNFANGWPVPAGSPWLTLVPVSVVSPAISRNAVRAARYGHARTFFFDDWAYPERDGFWTRANGTADVVIDTDDAGLPGLPISITAGGVPTTIRLSMGKWDQSLALAAGQQQEVLLPPAVSAVWRLRIRSGAGSRPSERDPGSRDVRSLAAWIAIH